MKIDRTAEKSLCNTISHIMLLLQQNPSKHDFIFQSIYVCPMFVVICLNCFS